MQAKSYNTFRPITLEQKRKICSRTYYLRADQDVEEPSTLPGELLGASEF
jgi:hypothetical protein